MKAFAILAFCILSSGVAAKAPLVAEYGQPLSYLHGVVEYPEFSLRFQKREEHRVGAFVRAVSYSFEVLDTQKKEVGRMTFTMSGLYEPVRVFVVDGKTFAAEMFYTTAGQPATRESPPKKDGSLPHDQIVVWDQATAKIANPQLLQSFASKKPNKAPEPTPTSVMPAAEQPSRRP